MDDLNSNNNNNNFDDLPLENREEYKFKNGAVYKGQWKGEVRHGFGIQIWPDGARYEGHW